MTTLPRPIQATSSALSAGLQVFIFHFLYWLIVILAIIGLPYVAYEWIAQSQVQVCSIRPVRMLDKFVSFATNQTVSSCNRVGPPCYCGRGSDGKEKPGKP